MDRGRLQEEEELSLYNVPDNAAGDGYVPTQHDRWLDNVKVEIDFFFTFIYRIWKIIIFCFKLSDLSFISSWHKFFINCHWSMFSV